MNNLSKKYGLSSNSIKMIAAIAMLIDHFPKFLSRFLHLNIFHMVFTLIEH